ncbi:hypothetical protein BDZ89DRAFT_1060979 [Hymenopellis radicata]|nr:hypothetical protein BDZ89DRAFT_1060979 [Hymenopellis radicata]
MSPHFRFGTAAFPSLCAADYFKLNGAILRTRGGDRSIQIVTERAIQLEVCVFAVMNVYVLEAGPSRAHQAEYSSVNI